MASAAKVLVPRILLFSFGFRGGGPLAAGGACEGGAGAPEWHLARIDLLVRPSVVDVAIVLDLPSAVAPAHEPVIGSGEGRVGENVRVIGRIDAVQAARLHVAALVAAVADERRHCRAGPENPDRKSAQDDGVRERSSHGSIHGGLLDASRRGRQLAPSSRLNWDA